MDRSNSGCAISVCLNITVGAVHNQKGHMSFENNAEAKVLKQTHRITITPAHGMHPPNIPPSPSITLLRITVPSSQRIPCQSQSGRRRPHHENRSPNEDSKTLDTLGVEWDGLQTQHNSTLSMMRSNHLHRRQIPAIRSAAN